MDAKKRIQVLLAEDDYLICESLASMITSLGYEVSGMARDGEDAVLLTASKRPDVVLMDIQMPKVHGLEAARRIQKQCPTPIVVLTAHETRELVTEATRVGVAAYLTKPPKPEEIHRAVAIAIARHEDLLELRQLNEALENGRRQIEAISEKLAIRNAELCSALKEIRTLQGILPICSFCKKVRNDDGYWDEVDAYISKHTSADISHSICPSCFEKEYLELHSKKE